MTASPEDEYPPDGRMPEAPYTGPILPAHLHVSKVDSSSAHQDIQAALRIADRRMHQKAMIVNELLETERMYVHDLRTLVESFFDRLNAVSWVPSDKKFSLMRNASELYRFQQEFLLNLENAINAPRRDQDEDLVVSVALVFIELQQKFEVYSQYCTHHDGAIKILSEYETRPEMVTFLKDFRGLAQTKLDVKDYLIKPVQRLCRYPLLISEMIKNTPIDSHHFSVLLAAHSVMQNVALEIDSAKWRMDNLERTNRFFTRLEAAPADLPRRLDVGDFILSGALHVINYDQYALKLRYRGVFLFPEYIFVVKPRRMTAYSLKICLSLSSCEFRHLGPGESPLPNAWRLINMEGGQTYDFCAQSEKERLAWTDILSRLAVPAKATIPTAGSHTSAVFGPSSSTSSVSDFFDNMRRSSSVGSLSGMSEPSSTVAIPRERLPTTPSFQRKKFWRQSSADVRLDAIMGPEMPAGGPPTPGNANSGFLYHPVMGLTRRASVDMRLLDVRSPLPDNSMAAPAAPAPAPATATTAKRPVLSSARSVPNMHRLHRSATLNDLDDQPIPLLPLEATSITPPPPNTTVELPPVHPLRATSLTNISPRRAARPPPAPPRRARTSPRGRPDLNATGSSSSESLASSSGAPPLPPLPTSREQFPTKPHHRIPATPIAPRQRTLLSRTWSHITLPARALRGALKSRDR
ncbi:Pleckstrin y domain-containing G member 1 [Thoreauomyces humboldtii]|nr:Pleckstrin y domain-containing G member 1 [Thoreauomyces humboldtii]